MCIRGLDYCPPVDVDFGSYLCGVITADAELWPQDEDHYRVAFIEAFRQWGIYPEGAREMSESELRYPRLNDPRVAARSPRGMYRQEATREIFPRLNLDWGLGTDRAQVWETMQANAEIIHGWLTGPSMRRQLQTFGLTLDAKGLRSVYQKDRVPTVEVHSVRVARRRGFRDTLDTDLVVEVRQRRRGYLDPDVQKEIDAGKKDPRKVKHDFYFRRGCTLIIDPAQEQVRYAIATRGDVTDNDELDRVRGYLAARAALVDNPFFGAHAGADLDDEHFAALHRSQAAAPDF
jgi:hypothetical protein